LCDATRKSIEISCVFEEQQKISGWRKASDCKKRIKIELNSENYKKQRNHEVKTKKHV
jgi:hypothetical protein